MARFLAAKYSPRIYTFNADADSLQLISLEDGVVVEEYSLAPLFEQFPTAEAGRVLPRRKMIGIYDATQDRCLLYEFASHKIVDCLPADLESVDVSKDETFLVIGRGSHGVSVFDLQTLSIRWLHRHAGALVARKLSADESQLITVCDDGSVNVLDVATGNVLRTYRSRAAVLPVFGCVLAGFIAWCLVWVRAGVRLQSSPLVDAIFLNGLIAAALIVRLNLSGSMQDGSRLAYLIAQSLFASWLVLLTGWVVFGKARWSLRILAPLVGMAVSFALALLNFRGDDFGVWQRVIGAIVGSIACILWFGLLRRSGHFLSQVDRTSVLPAQEWRSIPLRDIFFITAAVAALLAVVRFVSPHQFAAREAAELTLVVTIVSFTGVTATWAGLSQRHWIVRLLLLCLIVLAGGSVLYIVFPDHRHWHHWRFAARNEVFVAIFTLGTAFLFRSRGWRLRRAVQA